MAKGKETDKEARRIPVHCAHDEMVEVERIVPNPRNPNTHPDMQVALLAKIIRAQGWRSPITVSQRSGFVVRGHGRLMAAHALGELVVPVDYQNYATEADEWADLVADNRIAELSEMDSFKLKDLLIEIDTGAIDMNLTGFDNDELERMMTAVGYNPNGVEPPEALPDTGLTGDLVKTGRMLLVYQDADERARILDIFGLPPDDVRVVFTVDDLPALNA